MKESLLNFDQGLLLILKWDSDKGINKRMVRKGNRFSRDGWFSEKRRLYNQECTQQCVLENEHLM